MSEYRGFGEGKTIDEIAKILGVTREQVKQIEAQALRKLKRILLNHPLRDDLASFIFRRRA
ncbi:MAG: hypothetical protein LBI57_07490 [Helicobacteraceae bacterium]|jgi:DNA-directed RNA polymerase sigma subunit (sigma70/sigma32)|nr:hypothetical protein [Helicobacteraceae bacterium]